MGTKRREPTSRPAPLLSISGCGMQRSTRITNAAVTTLVADFGFLNHAPGVVTVLLGFRAIVPNDALRHPNAFLDNSPVLFAIFRVQDYHTTVVRRWGKGLKLITPRYKGVDQSERHAAVQAGIAPTDIVARRIVVAIPVVRGAIVIIVGGIEIVVMRTTSAETSITRVTATRTYIPGIGAAIAAVASISPVVSAAVSTAQAWVVTSRAIPVTHWGRATIVSMTTTVVTGAAAVSTPMVDGISNWANRATATTNMTAAASRSGWLHGQSVARSNWGSVSNRSGWASSARIAGTNDPANCSIIGNHIRGDDDRMTIHAHVHVLGDITDVATRFNRLFVSAALGTIRTRQGIWLWSGWTGIASR
jgi:hypothetical protein